MDWKSHAVIGAFFAIAVLYVFGVQDNFLLVLFGLFGALSALVPDLDHDSSKGRRILDVVFVSFAFLAVYLGECGGGICVPQAGKIFPMATLFFALVGAYFILFRFFKPRHRGITHTLVACFVFGVLMYLLLGLTVALAGIAGYFSHLVADRHVKLI